MRDALLGLTRFAEFQKNLGVAPNILSRRLNHLVKSGMLERRVYSKRPRREEYLLTERARDFENVLWAIVMWANKHLAPEGPSVVIVDAKTGAPAAPVFVDRKSGRVLAKPEFRTAPGPAANAYTRRQHTWNNGKAYQEGPARSSNDRR